MGLRVRGPVRIVQLQHVLFFQREVVFRELLQFAQYFPVCCWLLQQIEYLEQNLVLCVLPDDGAGFSHPTSLDAKTGLRHDLGQFFFGDLIAS